MSKFKSLKYIILFLALIFTFNVASAITEDIHVTPDQTLSLNDCIKLALNNSKTIRQYKAYVDIAKAMVGQAKSDYFPSLKLGTDYNYDHSGGDTSSNSNYYGMNVSLNQLIYNFGKTGALIKKQKYNKISADFDLENEILKTIYEVKIAYYGVHAAKTYVDIEEEYIKINLKQYERTKAFFEEGLKSKIDLVNSEVYLSEAKINFIIAQNAYENSIIDLNKSLQIIEIPKYKITNLNQSIKGKPADVELINITNKVKEEEKTDGKNIFHTNIEKTEIINDYKIDKFPYTMEQSLALAKAQRPDLKSYLATESAMKEELKYVKREFLPDLAAGVGYDLMKGNNINKNSVYIGAGLDFPLINGMKTKCRIEEAQAQLSYAHNAVQLIEEKVYYEVQNAYIDMLQYEKKLPLLQTKVRQAKENFDLAEGRYEVGLGNFIELQDAKVNYNNAQKNYVKAIFDYNVAKAKLEKTIAIKDNDLVKI